MAELGVVLTEPHHGYRREEYASFEGRFIRVVRTLRVSHANLNLKALLTMSVEIESHL